MECMGTELRLDIVIRREMRAKSLTLNALAKATGIPQSSLHNWLSKRPPAGKNLAQIKRLSEYLGLSLSALLFDVTDEVRSQVLYRSEFTDADKRYRLTIEKIES